MSIAPLVATAIVLVGFQPNLAALPADLPVDALRCIESFGGRVIPAREPDGPPCVDPDPGAAPPHGPWAVRFFNTHLTDLDLVAVTGALMQIDDLEKVDLSYTRVRGETLGCLAGLPSLKELDLSSTPISGDGLRELARLGQSRPLERLKLNHTSLDRDAALSLKDPLAATLTTLHLSGTRVLDPRTQQPLGADEVLGWIDEFGVLEDLNLSGALAMTEAAQKSGVAGLGSWAKLPNLTHLDLSNNALKSGSIRGLWSLTHLTDLRLGGNRELTDADFWPTWNAGFPLTKLDVSGTQLTDWGLALLAWYNRGLVELNISGTPTLVHPLSPYFLRLLDQLVALNIASTGVTDAILTSIWRNDGLPELACLDISGTTVTDKGLATDPPNPTVGFRCLRSINTTNSGVTPAGINRRQVLNALILPLPACATTHGPRPAYYGAPSTWPFRLKVINFQPQ